MSPSVSVTGQPVATTNLYNLLSRVQAVAKTGTPSHYVLFKPMKVTTTTGTGKNRKTRTSTVWRACRRPDGAAASRSDDRERRPPRRVPRQDPEGLEGPDGAVADRRDHLRAATTSTVCPGDPNGLPAAGTTDYYLFKHGRLPERPLRALSRT